MAFVEVVTRCYRRPGYLKNNRESLEAQTFADWEQTLLVDDVGIGLDAANRQLATFEPDGEYVWILDDDDMAARDTLFEEVHDLVQQTGADMVIVKMDHGARGILPAPWQFEPSAGLIGVSAAFIRRDLWQKCAEAWQRPGYDSDGFFMCEVFRQAEQVAWHDVIGSRVQRISLGAPE